MANAEVVMTETLPSPGKRRSDFVNGPYSPKFPHTNQAFYCWSAFVQYQICIRERDPDSWPCTRAKCLYRSMCPKVWKEAWEEQVDQGVFAGQIFWAHLADKNE